MSVIEDILLSVLVEDWYYGLVLNVILIFMFFVAVEKAEEHLNPASAIILALLGTGVVICYIIWIWKYSKIIPIVTGLVFIWMGAISVKIFIREHKDKKNRK